MILLIDNYDSFTFNLAQTLQAHGARVEVHRNDAMQPEDFLALTPSAIVISPGPGSPRSAGVSLALFQLAPPSLPILGVCLGHQALVESEGGLVTRDLEPTHGKASSIHHDGSELFRGVNSPFPAGRYHTLHVVRKNLPASLRVTAWTEEGGVMAVQHRKQPRFGVQFHPESILTPQGSRLCANFLCLAGEPSRRVLA